MTPTKTAATDAALRVRNLQVEAGRQLGPMLADIRRTGTQEEFEAALAKVRGLADKHFPPSVPKYKP